MRFRETTLASAFIVDIEPREDDRGLADEVKFTPRFRLEEGIQQTVARWRQRAWFSGGR